MFRDRKDAGVQLAEKIKDQIKGDAAIFALPRGGVVLGAEIARRLQAPLDLILTKKIGHPSNPEYAICAIAEEGEPICNQAELDRIDPEWFQKEITVTRAELKRRRREYLGNTQSFDVNGKIAIIVDDGIATGLTMMAAIAEMKKRAASKIVVAIPVTPYDTAQNLIALGVELISIKIELNYLGAVGAYYEDFRQVTDSEVISLLESVNRGH